MKEETFWFILLGLGFFFAGIYSSHIVNFNSLEWFVFMFLFLYIYYISFNFSIHYNQNRILEEGKR